METFSLRRFTDAQNDVYTQALSELRSGHKRTHWMWFIFPQIQGLGQSDLSKYYGIGSLEEARAYLDHPLLGGRLLEICQVLIDSGQSEVREIFPTPDDLKLRSSMTLFSRVPQSNPVFQQVLDKFFHGLPDPRTLTILAQPM